MNHLLHKPNLSSIKLFNEQKDLLGLNRQKQMKVFLDRTTSTNNKILISAMGFLKTYADEVKAGEHDKLNIHDLNLLKTVLDEMKKELKRVKTTPNQIKTTNIELFENMAKIKDTLDVMGAIVGIALLDKYIADSGRLKVLTPIVAEIIKNHKNQSSGKNDKQKRRIFDNTLLGAENIYNMFHGDDIVTKEEFYHRRTRLSKLFK